MGGSWTAVVCEGVRLLEETCVMVGDTAVRARSASEPVRTPVRGRVRPRAGGQTVHQSQSATSSYIAPSDWQARAWSDDRCSERQQHGATGRIRENAAKQSKAGSRDVRGGSQACAGEAECTFLLMAGSPYRAARAEEEE